MKTLKKFLGIILIASMGGFSGVAVYKATEKDEISNAKNITDKQKFSFVNYKADMPSSAFNFTDAAVKTVPAVVYVRTTYPQRSSNYYNPFQDFFFGNPQNQPAPQAAGSGVIISEDGYIVTNNHVVDEAAKVEVTLDDKRTFTAKVIGTDPSTDLALLKIDQKNLSYIPYGNSDDVKIGEWVLAVGNPFNLTSTVTAGIVSAKGRNIHILDNQSKFPLESFIQTDAAVNPGNSGGALVNTSGELVGINSAIASNTGSYAGYAFAIPVNIVKKVMDDLLEYGNVQRGFIGINIRDIDQKLVEEKNLKVYRGVYVQNLTEGGAAETAGIKSGDIITKVGGVGVSSSTELQEQVGRYRPGDKVEVSLLRDDKEKLVDVVLRNNQGNTRLVKNDEVVNMLGAEFSQPSEDEVDRLGINSGVKISKLGPGKLRNAGIKEGFIITKIDNQKINSADELQQALENKKGGILIEGIYPNGMRAYYGFGM